MTPITDSWATRLPVGAKMLTLIALSITTVALHGVRSAAALLGFVLVLAVSTRVPARTLLRTLRGIVLFAVVVAALQWWWIGPARALESLLDLTTLALLGVLLTATTPVGDMLEAFVRWAGPMRRFGVDPERVGLVISMAVEAIPGTITLARETRDAARTRGLERSPRALLTPFVIRVVARAHEKGAALQARGIGD
ncbi:energy-coupling factor transporter transmembrane component T family protein [Nocardioides sp. Iso805N]|uniref:energy-coupling factor transporter transmembrane component T family protein n=1 Tax=Nocardioides sp. Iso805N TaxID=1283287 RepID=UPI000374F621|nr:energy-coupling factor transporter transmembrane protein EcfT [Nocardioides sp. Iso805N]